MTSCRGGLKKSNGEAQSCMNSSQVKNLITRMVFLTVPVLAILFGISVVGSAPWELIFQKGTSGEIQMIISQPKIGVEAAVIHTGVKAADDFREVVVSKFNGQQKLPIGEIAFYDPTLLPGRLTLKIENHSIDLMQTSLTLDGRHIQWNTLEAKSVQLNAAP